MEKKAKCTSSGCCGNQYEKDSIFQISRRDFVKIAGLGTSGFVLMPPAGAGIMAGPYTSEDFQHLIPADKKLSPEWVRSLTERGVLETFTSAADELKYIGMPIGGICCGQLYISGDGRLWLWDIFQSNYEREGPASGGWRLDQFTFGGLYAKPRTSMGNDRHSVNQGFALKVVSDKKSIIKTLDQDGFKDITFRGEYPVARVTYKDKDFPLEVNLTAFSPYIPHNTKDSGIPVTILQYDIRNTGRKNWDVSLTGWLENKVCPDLGIGTAGERISEIIRSNQKVTLFHTAKGERLSERKGYGNMALSVIGEGDIKYSAGVGKEVNAQSVFQSVQDNHSSRRSQGFDESLVGAVAEQFSLEPGESKSVTFLLSWYFPYYNEQNPEGGQMQDIKEFPVLHRHYKNIFDSAENVAAYVTDQLDRLVNTTLLWNKTWYDSTLPWWFLDRTFISMDCLASQTCHLFDNGRFWSWEGVDCCEGTCTHVWNYAQGMARIFPSLEKDLRHRVDYGIAYHEDGSISYRGENKDRYTGLQFATDGQLGTILRVYREHQMSSDYNFLKSLWQRIKKSMQFIIDQDRDQDGILEGKQSHTLDASWDGPMGWISSLYLAVLSACSEMAGELGDDEFSEKCKTQFEKGQKKIVEDLFDGEYFIHIPPDFKSINTNDGCHIDQVIGQSWAWQVHLPRILPQKETLSALSSLWKYNFAPDAGQYRIDHKTIKGARIYAMPGEAGLLMTTWPKGGDEKAVPGMAERQEDQIHWPGPGGYFDECMNGFEYQVASHMVWEGMITEGMAITKAIHERYGANKRNPYDEIECSSHYVRSMAAYGIFLAACGSKYHGPKGFLGFDPRIHPEKFKCPFTVAEGWGTYMQQMEETGQKHQVLLIYGKLKLKSLSFGLIKRDAEVASVMARLDSEVLDLTFRQNENKLLLTFNTIQLKAEAELEIMVKY
jgi:non-lysosomal glucosylceramidase